MAGGIRGNSVRHNVLIPPRSTFYGVSRPEWVFQDIQGVVVALTLKFLEYSIMQIFPEY